MTNRRNVLKSAAWTLPVIAAAVAAPAASASQPEPFACHRVPGKGQPHWVGTYSDGTSVTMDNGTAMSGPFGDICRAAGDNPGAGK